MTGAARPAVLASGWQLAHAAVRRRKPVVVVDLAGHRELPAMLAAVCAAAAAPLQVFGNERPTQYAPSTSPAGEDVAALRASPLGRRLSRGPATADRISLNEAVRRRAVVLFSLDRRRNGRAAEVIANLVAADLAAIYAALGRTGIAPDGLCWFTECDGIDAGALGRLAGPGGQAGLAAVLTTIAPAPAARLAEQVNVGVFHRLTDRELAPRLAALTGTRLVPISRIPARQAADVGAAPPGGPADPAVPLGTMPYPVVPADALCGLGDDEFVLVTGLAAASASQFGLAQRSGAGRSGSAARGGDGGRGARRGSAVTVLAPCQAIAGRIPAAPAGQARGRRGPPARTLPPPGRPA